MVKCGERSLTKTFQARDEKNFMTLLRLCEADCVNPEKEAKKTSRTDNPEWFLIVVRGSFSTSLLPVVGEQQQQGEPGSSTA
jgi:hypothetical protein